MFNYMCSIQNDAISLSLSHKHKKKCKVISHFHYLSRNWKLYERITLKNRSLQIIQQIEKEINKWIKVTGETKKNEAFVRFFFSVEFRCAIYRTLICIYHILFIHSFRCDKSCEHSRVSENTFAKFSRWIKKLTVLGKKMLWLLNFHSTKNQQQMINLSNKSSNLRETLIWQKECKTLRLTITELKKKIKGKYLVLKLYEKLIQFFFLVFSFFQCLFLRSVHLF